MLKANVDTTASTKQMIDIGSIEYLEEIYKRMKYAAEEARKDGEIVTVNLTDKISLYLNPKKSGISVGSGHSQ